MAARSRRERQSSRKPRRDPIARERALDALSQMRSKNLSLTAAARLSHTTPQTVRKHVGSALRRTAGNRYRPTPSDRFTRHVLMLTRDGNVEVKVRNSRTASRIARYMANVHKYLGMGDAEGLHEFRGTNVRAGGETFEFITNLEMLDRLALAGEVSFDRLYVLRS